MKFVALLLGMAIVCLLVVKRAQPSQVAEAMQEADAVVAPVNSGSSSRPSMTPTPSASSPQSSKPGGTTGLRAPLDRTRSVVDQVRQRNGANDF